MTKKKKILLNITAGTFALAVPFASLGITATGINVSEASNINSTGFYSTPVTLTNSSFNDISGNYSSNDVNGWNRILKNGSTKNMIIDVVKGWSSKSTIYSDTYYLPSTMKSPNKDGQDDKVLMISSANSKGKTDGYGHDGYKNSNAIELDGNSYYSFKVSMKTVSFNTAQEYASIYLTNTIDKAEETLLSFENQNAPDWTEYYFFVATDEKQEVNLEMWLGNRTSDSYGAVFFDSVEVWEYSENAFYDALYNDHSSLIAGNYVQNDNTKALLLRNSNALTNSELSDEDLNFDFEDVSDGSLTDWSVSSQTANAYAEILNITSKEVFESKTGYTYPGTNYGHNNEKSLVLWASNQQSVTVESNMIDIKAHGLYKVSMSVKTDLGNGAFYIKASEKSEKGSYGIYKDFPHLNSDSFKYELKTGSSSAITSSENKATNGYTTATFYIQGHNRFDTKASIQLALENATGFVVVDDITIEHVSSEDFDSSNAVVFSVYSNDSSSSQSVYNGNFDFTTNENNLVYPLAPSDWTIERNSNLDENNQVSGIVNTYSKYFNAYSSTPWGNTTNPATHNNPPYNANISNNVFMFWNKVDSYQSVKSTAFKVESGKYYQFSMDVKTFAETAPLSIEFVDEDGIILHSDKNVTSSTNGWNKYQVSFWTGDTTHQVSVKIYFGTKDAPVSGYAYIDNAEINESTEEIFTTAQNKIDLSNFMLNLDPNSTISNEISQSTAFTGSMESGSMGVGGIIKGAGNDRFTYGAEGKLLDADTELTNNVLVISTRGQGTYSLTAKSKLDVTKDEFYKLSFKLLTDLPVNLPEKDADNNEITYNYGVKIGLTGFETVEKLIQNDGWDTYEVYFKATETTTTQFYFALVSDRLETIGNAFVTDIVWEKSSEEVYTALSDDEKLNKTKFISLATTQPDEDDSTEEPDTSTETETEINWLLIPSIIFGVAIIVAIVGWLLRKINIKKVEKVQQQEYDRRISLNKEVVSAEAEKIRQEEVKVLEKEEKEIKAQIEELEENHKKATEEARIKNNGKITKEVEKMFKEYTSKKHKLNDRLQNIRETIATTKSPEYLLALERKVVSNSKKAKELNLKDE